MSYQIDKLVKMNVAVLVALFWALAAYAPFLASNHEFWANGEGPLIVVAIASYPIYTGIRAWRRGWKARFVLRIVVPAALFLTGCAVFGVIAWLT